jgi:hypothetical protein
MTKVAIVAEAHHQDWIEPAQRNREDQCAHHGA